MARLEADEEQSVLVAMHETLVDHGLCLREHTDLIGNLAVLVSYPFKGFLDDIYSALVVRFCHTIGGSMAKSEQFQLAHAIRSDGTELPDGFIGQDQPAKEVDGVRDPLHAAAEIIVQGGRFETEHVPAAVFHEVVAGIVVDGGIGRTVPGVAVAFDIDVSLGTEQGEVEAVPLALRSLPPLPLGLNLFLLHRGPQSVLQRAAVNEVVDLDGLDELLPNRRDEDHSAAAPAVDRLGTNLQWSQGDPVVKLVRTGVGQVGGQEFGPPNLANAFDTCPVPDRPLF